MASPASAEGFDPDAEGEGKDQAVLRGLVTGCIVATLAFWAYSRTLLPGVDLGDTGGFQAAVLWPDTSARTAYPLYYGLARAFVGAVSPGNPARGLNLFSAVWAALAAGGVAFVVALIARSVIAGAVSGVLLAFSYTYWTQAVIAEVYALNLALVTACLLALHAYAVRPGLGRLAVFFAIYALSFGNHLSMVLWLLPFALFVLLAHPSPTELLRPRIVALAVVITAAGALQYAADFFSVWSSVDAPPTWKDRIAAFWFDTTKADWRESMVLGVERSQASERLAMWAWDARQQFGLAGLALAVVGAMRLWTISRPWAALLWTSFAATTIFALTYNVGDTHVFFLPGHLLTAVAAGVALAPLRTSRRVMQRALAGLGAIAIAYGGWRGWDTWPAADRHQDRRADALVARVAAQVHDQGNVLVSAMNWQADNALLYASRFERRDVAWTKLADVRRHFPFLVRDNHAIGRDVILTAEAAVDVVATYGSLFTLVPEEPILADSFAAAVPRGSPYVLTLLPPEEPVDPDELAMALATLSNGRVPERQTATYEVWAGVAGERPAFYRSSARPFRARIAIAGDTFTIRMDAWMPTDTFRRGGFGHVLRGRERLLFVERGLSLLWFRADGSAAHAYAAGLYAPKARVRIPAVAAQLARSW